MKRLVVVPLLAVLIAACSAGSSTSPSSSTAPAQAETPSQAPAPAQAKSSPSAPPTAEPFSPSPGPEGSPAAGPEGEAFVDPEGMYRLTISDAWEPRHGAVAQGIEVWLTHPPADGFSPNVNILVQATGPMTLDQYTQTSLDNAPQFIEDFELIDSRTVTGPGGTELAVVEYSGTAGGANRPMRFQAVWTVHEGNGIVATFTSLAEHFEAQRDEVLPYLLTLEPT